MEHSSRLINSDWQAILENLQSSKVPKPRGITNTYYLFLRLSMRLGGVNSLCQILKDFSSFLLLLYISFVKEGLVGRGAI